MRQINKVAVLGSGVMGATIAAHLANAGVSVVLLDIVPNKLTEKEEKNGLGLNDKAVRNRIVVNGLQGLKKMKPDPLFSKDYLLRIEPGNFEDDIQKLKECDWVVEVVIENMDIKKKLFTEKVVPNLKKGAILSTNTSGLSVNELAKVLPDDVKKNFLVTHFFNPPRYMRLMELVPCKYTDKNVMDTMSVFTTVRLGKGVVYAKDTPNFVANRIGVYSIFKAIYTMIDMDMTVEEVDAVAGEPTGKPKSAAFRTTDLVGIDTMVHVGNNSYEYLKEDEERDIFKVPEFINNMIKKGILGNKTKKGFYKKVKEDGGTTIYHYDYKTGEYKKNEKPKFASIQAVKQIDDPKLKLKTLLGSDDKASKFAWINMRDTLLYTFRRIPEIADDILNVDNAMKWGFNWEIGPFEMFDIMGVKKFVKRVEKDGVEVPEKLKKIESFYKYEDGESYYYDILTETYKPVPMDKSNINLNILKKKGKEVEKNSSASILDLGDGVFCLEFHTKMNAIGASVQSSIRKAIKRAENEGVGLVIANQSKQFSVGANIMLLAAGIAEGEFDEINLSVKDFQKTSMAIKYSQVPVVAAPFNLTLGGGCEFCLHADAINAHAETYMGLVEMGVGLLPAGGGTKEMGLRAIKGAELLGTDVSSLIFKNFENIAMAKVSFSADMLFELGYMRRGDSVTMNIDNLIYDSKQKVLALASNYRPSKPAINLKAPGKSVAASVKSQLWNMNQGKYITDYEMYMAGLVADVMTGGDVNAGTLITEEYLLDIEREAFLKLCGEKKTLERIQHMLKKGRPLRN